MRAIVFALCLLSSAAMAGAAMAQMVQDGGRRTWPDKFKTPGATNPNVTQANIRKTVCRANWTKTIRPPSSYTTNLKLQQIEQYGYRNKKPGAYEEDHLISLQLGGDPHDPRNLWPEAYAGKCGARVKDVIETRLKRLVCAKNSTLTLAEAQELIRANWVGAYIQYIAEIDCPAP